jgi:DNA-binding CsgD family transcriptional regulator
VSNRLRELARAVDLLANVAELTRSEHFPDVVLPGLAGIVPCDVVTYNEIDVRTATVQWSAHPLDALDPATAPVFAAHVHEHPLVNHMQRTGDGTPKRLSDFLAPRELHELGLYNEFFRPAGVEHQMAMTLCAPTPTVVGIALNRSRRDFTDYERDVVNLLRAPLAASFARLRRRADAATVLSGTAPCGLTPGGLAPGVLTDREQQVLELVAEGRTDAAIGHLLGCSRRTVGKHLEHAYRKLGVDSRAAAVAETARRTD